MALLSLAVSCRGESVYSRQPEELKRALRSGDSGFLAQVPDDRLNEASALGAGGAYCLARQFSRLGLEDRATRLYALEWHSSKSLAGSLACRELIASCLRSGDWEGVVTYSTEFLYRHLDDPEALYARLYALVRLGRDEQALALHASRAWEGYAPNAAAARACVAVASLRLGRKGAQEEVDFLVRQGKDPEALRILSESLLPESDDKEARPIPVGDADRNLLLARSLVAAREYHDAVQAFRQDPALFSASPSQGLLSDAGKAWLYGGAQEEGAGLFAALAARIPEASPEERALAFLYAGRCGLAAGKKDAALACFLKSFESAKRGRTKDAAAWFLIDATPRLEDAVALARSSAPAWDDPGYFSDIVARLIRDALGSGAYSQLAILRDGLSAHVLPAVAERLSYIAERSRSLGLLKSGDAQSVAAPPSAVPGFSYYAIMSAALASANADAPPAAEPSPDPRPSPLVPAARTEEERFAWDLVEYGLASELPAFARGRSSGLGEDFLRGAAAWLDGSGFPSDAARVMGVLAGRPGYAPSTEDLAIEYPRPWAAEIRQAAAEFGLPEQLLFALVRTESYFDQRAVSAAGAVGLTQLMPDTGKTAAAQLNIANPDLLDPLTNLRLGAYYLGELTRYFGGDAMKALLAYNGGMGRVRRWMKESPAPAADLFLEAVPLDETRDYGRKVLAAQAVYGYLYYSVPMRDTVFSLYPGIANR